MSTVVDYLVAHHGEQDHSGSHPGHPGQISAGHPGLLAQGQGHPDGPPRDSAERIVTVADGETLSLGDKTLEFVHTPWVHWPETMCTYLREDRILFSCDFFGSHLAQSEIFVRDEKRNLPCGQALFRRDHDAVPDGHPEKPGADRRSGRSTSSPRAMARSTTGRPSSSTPTAIGFPKLRKTKR